MSIPGRKRIEYAEQPHFERPLPDIPRAAGRRMYDRLRFLYGTKAAKPAMQELVRLLKVHHAYKTDELIEAERASDLSQRFSERDMIMITTATWSRAKGARL
jgi:sucrose phosphorylase